MARVDIPARQILLTDTENNLKSKLEKGELGLISGTHKLLMKDEAGNFHTFVDTSEIFAGSTAGLVPTATAGDADKVLKGNGSWGDAASPISAAQDNPMSITQGQGNQLILGVDSPFNEAIADEFSTTETYEVGDYVMHKSKFYRCTTAVSVAGEWVAASWTETSVDEILAGIAIVLDTVNDNLESVAHAGMYDLGNKTESDLTDGKLAIGAGNSTTKLTLTTISTLTVLANSGVPNFALVIDNSGNSNDVTITVKDSTDTDTFMQNVNAGNEVTSGKIFQLTCVGNCWTLAEFGTANA